MDNKVTTQLTWSKREEREEGRGCRQWTGYIEPLDHSLQEVGVKVKLKT